MTHRCPASCGSGAAGSRANGASDSDRKLLPLLSIEGFRFESEVKFSRNPSRGGHAPRRLTGRAKTPPLSNGVFKNHQSTPPLLTHRCPASCGSGAAGSRANGASDSDRKLLPLLSIEGFRFESEVKSFLEIRAGRGHAPRRLTGRGQRLRSRTESLRITRAPPPLLTHRCPASCGSGAAGSRANGASDSDRKLLPLLSIEGFRFESEVSFLESEQGGVMRPAG